MSALDTQSGAIAFTDIVGFTQFTASEGDEHRVELLERKEQLVATICRHRVAW